ncbi:MAG: hypothetical protein PHZ19_06595 [Candidatus Thermoplasmatota archaeon]|nr:hypothetical protein [Candidatus Thermoplasmatota archaeon]
MYDTLSDLKSIKKIASWYFFKAVPSPGAAFLFFWEVKKMIFAETEKRRTTLCLVVSEREAQAVKEAAKQAGVSLSKFVRRAVGRELAQGEAQAHK